MIQIGTFREKSIFTGDETKDVKPVVTNIADIFNVISIMRKQ